MTKIRIGFTVGTWDLWHENHVNFLKVARTHCDVLYVGIVTDRLVYVQKGAGRPIDVFAKRKANLALSGLADRIVILDTLDMTPYLQMSDVWILGGDQYRMLPEDYPNCVYIPRFPGVSTTEKLKEEK